MVQNGQQKCEEEKLARKSQRREGDREGVRAFMKGEET